MGGDVRRASRLITRSTFQKFRQALRTRGYGFGKGVNDGMGQAGCKVSGVSRKLDRIQSGVFGASGDMSRADIAYGLDEAGQRAIEKLQDIREGIDPQAEKVADRNALTYP